MSKKVLRHPSQGRIVRTIPRPQSGVLAALEACPTASILDILGKHGAMIPTIASIMPGMRVCGPAITCLGADLTVRRMAIDLARPGDVLVLAVNGVVDQSCFGAYTALKMREQGITGVVIDGATRDAAQLREIGFPTFARAVTPRNFHYPVAPEYGSVNVPVVCGGVIVNPGDIIVGDDDGVIVVPHGILDGLGEMVLESMRSEEAKWAKRAGTLFNVEETLLQQGYVFED